MEKITYEKAIDVWVKSFNEMAEITKREPIDLRKHDFIMDGIIHVDVCISYNNKLLYFQSYCGNNEAQREIMYKTLLYDLCSVGVVQHYLLKHGKDKIN